MNAFQVQKQYQTVPNQFANLLNPYDNANYCQFEPINSSTPQPNYGDQATPFPDEYSPQEFEDAYQNGYQKGHNACQNQLNPTSCKSYPSCESTSCESTSWVVDRLNPCSKKISKEAPVSNTSTNTAKRSRRRWCDEEDEQILRMVQAIGLDWAAIAKSFRGTVTGKQIRDRYMNKLDSRINNSKWTTEDDKKLIELFHVHGRSWMTIARNLPGRTEVTVKNRFYSKFRKLLDMEEEKEKCNDNARNTDTSSEYLSVKQTLVPNMNKEALSKAEKDRNKELTPDICGQEALENFINYNQDCILDDRSLTFDKENSNRGSNDFLLQVEERVNLLQKLVDMNSFSGGRIHSINQISQSKPVASSEDHYRFKRRCTSLVERIKLNMPKLETLFSDSILQLNQLIGFAAEQQQENDSV